VADVAEHASVDELDACARTTSGGLVQGVGEQRLQAVLDDSTGRQHPREYSSKQSQNDRGVFGRRQADHAKRL